MSIPWNPSQAPEKYDSLWLQRELNELKKALESASSDRGLKYLSAAPVRPYAGMEVLADGTNWDPGSGQGKYRRNADNDDWIFLG